VTAASPANARITINKSHKIFEGHFPGIPVVPGVCMMQIVLEMMEVSTGKQVSLVAADTMKFLSVINPEQNKEIDVVVNYTEDGGRMQISANLFEGPVIFFKLKATLKIN